MRVRLVSHCPLGKINKGIKWYSHALYYVDTDTSSWLSYPLLLPLELPMYINTAPQTQGGSNMNLPKRNSNLWVGWAIVKKSAIWAKRWWRRRIVAQSWVVATSEHSKHSSRCVWSAPRILNCSLSGRCSNYHSREQSVSEHICSCLQEVAWDVWSPWQ